MRLDNLLEIIHFLSFSVGIGGGVASMIIGIRLRSAEMASVPALMGVQKVIGRVSFGAIVLLWVTGLWMVNTRYGWSVLSAAFWVKFAFVLGLSAIALRMQYLVLMAPRRGPPDAKVMARLGMGSSLCAVLALVFAVVAFG